MKKRYELFVNHAHLMPHSSRTDATPLRSRDFATTSASAALFAWPRRKRWPEYSVGW